MKDYSRQVASAEAKIKDAGRLVTLKYLSKTGGTNYDPVMTPVESTAYAVEVNFTKQEIDNGLATDTSKVYLMPASSSVTSDMTVTDDVESSITKITRVRTGEPVIMYRVITNG